MPKALRGQLPARRSVLPALYVAWFRVREPAVAAA